MKQVYLFIFLIFYFSASILPRASIANAAAESFTLRGSIIYDDGAIIAQEVQVIPFSNSENQTNKRLRGANLVGIDTNEFPKLSPGLYFFDSAGKSLGMIDGEYIFPSVAILSPDGNFFGVDYGTSSIRGFLVVSWEEKLIQGDITFTGDIIWAENNYIFYTSPTEGLRPTDCNYQDCEAMSVSYFDAEKRKNTVLLQATAVCNYTLAGVKGKILSAIKTCRPSTKDWMDYEYPNETKDVLELDY